MGVTQTHEECEERSKEKVNNSSYNEGTGKLRSKISTEVMAHQVWAHK